MVAGSKMSPWLAQACSWSGSALKQFPLSVGLRWICWSTMERALPSGPPSAASRRAGSSTAVTSRSWRIRTMYSLPAFPSGAIQSGSSVWSSQSGWLL